MKDLKQIQEFFGPPAGVNTAYRVDFTRIENKEVVKDFELFKDLEKAKSKFEQLKKDPFMGSIKMEKIYGGQSGDGDRYLGGSEEIGSYSNPVNNTKSSELTDEENDIKIYMTTPSFVSAKRGYKEKEDLMAYLSRRKKATSDFVNGALEEMDINDPVLMKARAAKMKANQPKKSTNPNYKAVKNASKIAFLKKERAQLMRDMEQEAEPEGGPIADEYGDKLNRIDKAIAKLEGRKEMTYDQAIAEVKVDYDFSEKELIRVLRQLKRGASGEIGMIKAFTKALGRDITKDELFSEAIAEVAVPSSLITKFAAEVKDVNSFASLLLNLYDAIQDKEQKDFSKNQKFGRAIAFLRDLADDKSMDKIEEDETYASSFGGFRKKLDRDAIEMELQAKGYETPSTGFWNKILVSKNGERVAMIDTDESSYIKDGKSYQWSGTEKFINHVESLNEAFDELDDGYDQEIEDLIKAGPRLNKDRFEDVIYYIHNNWMAGNYGDDYAIRRISKYLNALEENINEGDTYEKMAAKGKKAGNLKQGTVRKRLNIPKGEKVPITKINKEISRLKKMDKDKDKKGVQLGDKNQKYYKALQLAKTLKTTTNVNEMKANEFVKTVNDEFDLETLELMKKVIDSRVELLNKMKDVANPRTVVKGFRRYDEIAETIKFIKENNPSATSEEIIKELKEIKELGETITEELCAAGKAYRKRRMAAGEKSSAYLSGRAVKVCKGQMSGRKKKKK